MSRTRVVVTGMGTTSPVGGDVASTWDALVNGRSGVRHIDADWAEELPVKIAGTPRSSRPRSSSGSRPAGWTGPRSSPWSRRWRPGRDAGLAEVEDDLDSDRLGVAMASGIGGVTTLLDNYDVLKEKGPRRVSPLAVPMLMPNAPAANDQPVRRRAGRGQHPGLGLRVRQRGDLAGGRPDPARPRRHRRRRRHRGGDPPAADGGVRQHDGAVQERRAIPTTVSRPWDTARDGFVLGEGAGVLVLESEEHAQARGAKIYAEVLGAGITADSHDIAQPDPAGRGGSRAILRALAESEIGPESIFHVNAHATSTPQGDIAEGLMLHATLG